MSLHFKYAYHEHWTTHRTSGHATLLLQKGRLPWQPGELLPAMRRECAQRKRHDAFNEPTRIRCASQPAKGLDHTTRKGDDGDKGRRRCVHAHNTVAEGRKSPAHAIQVGGNGA